MAYLKKLRLRNFTVKQRLSTGSPYVRRVGASAGRALAGLRRHVDGYLPLLLILAFSALSLL